MTSGPPVKGPSLILSTWRLKSPQEENRWITQVCPNASNGIFPGGFDHYFQKWYKKHRGGSMRATILPGAIIHRENYKSHFSLRWSQTASKRVKIADSLGLALLGPFMAPYQSYVDSCLLSHSLKFKYDSLEESNATIDSRRESKSKVGQVWI